MNENRMNLMMTILKVSLAVIGGLICFFLFFGPNPDATEAEKEAFMNGPYMNLGVYYTGFIVLTGLAIVVLFFVMQLITTPKKTLMSIAGIVAALIIFMIFKLAGTSDTNESLQLAEDVHVSDGTLATTTAGIYTVIVAIAIAALGAILLPLYARIKK